MTSCLQVAVHEPKSTLIRLNFNDQNLLNKHLKVCHKNNTQFSFEADPPCIFQVQIPQFVLAFWELFK